MCSLECGAKVIAWIQVVGAGLAVLLWIIALGFTINEGPELSDTMAQLNLTSSIEKPKEGYNIEQDKGHAVYTLVILTLVVLLIYHIAIFIIALLLIVGIYKNRMSYVSGWLVAKGILLALATGYMMLKFIALLFGMDSDLTYTIVLLVLDVLQFWVVYNFWDLKKGEIVSA